MGAGSLHEAVEAAFNAGDIDGIVALYEPDAAFVGEAGDTAVGLDAIRSVWAELVALGGQLSMTTRYVHEVEDVALLSNSWSFTIGGEVADSSTTAEVAHRQGDGSWRYVIDCPFGATDR